MPYHPFSGTTFRVNTLQNNFVPGLFERWLSIERGTGRSMPDPLDIDKNGHFRNPWARYHHPLVNILVSKQEV